MTKRILYPSCRLLKHVRIDRQFGRFALIVALLNSNVLAENGITLHADNCVACHAAMTGGEGTVLYTREDHAVKNFDELGKQVNRCQSSLGLNWSKGQIESVQQYLNSTFYNY